MVMEFSSPFSLPFYLGFLHLQLGRSVVMVLPFRMPI